MRTFVDNAGRTWTVAVNVDAIKRVRTLCNVNLLEIVEGDLLGRLANDPILLCDVLYDAKMGILNDNKGGTVERTWKPGENLSQPIMARAIRDGRYGAKDPEWGEMCRILKEWSIHWPEGFWAVDTGDVYRLWVTGEAAIDWEGSWQTKAVYNDPLREFEWGVFPNLPLITTETSEFGGKSFPAMAGVGGAGQYAVSEAARDRGTIDVASDQQPVAAGQPSLD